MAFVNSGGVEEAAMEFTIQKEDLVHTEKDGFVVIDRDALDSAAAG